MALCGRRFSPPMAPVLLLLASAPVALGAPRCPMPCKEATADCIRTDCANLRGVARRDCRERCRGLGGCAALRTLAEVVSSCHGKARTFMGSQELRVRRGNCAPIVVARAAVPDPRPVPLDLCRMLGETRSPGSARLAGVFQRVDVSPDGRHVAFELTDDHVIFPLTTLPPEEEGLWVVGADGLAPRKLAPASRAPPYKIWSDGAEVGVSTLGSALAFSPDGRTLVTLDRGPGPDGGDEVQVVTVDVETGRRFQVTQLPATPPTELDNPHPVTFAQRFVGNDRILFASYSNPESLNPDGKLAIFIVRRDGTGLRTFSVPPASGLASIVPEFAVLRGRPSVLDLQLALAPVVDLRTFPGPSVVSEVFLLEGDDLLQLTHFGRIDTRRYGLDVNGRSVLLRASGATDPRCENCDNPTENCQLFVIDTLGRRMRQLTFFRDQYERSLEGCDFGPPPGCSPGHGVQDPVTRRLFFASTCDPFVGANPYGVQLFSMRPDGSGLRQLTRSAGIREHADGSVSTEFSASVWGYSAVPR